MDAIKNWIIDIDKSMQFKNSHLLIGVMVYEQLLHLPIQIRFPIGGTHVTCRGSNLTNSLGRTKFTNYLGIKSWSLKPRQIYEPAGVSKGFLRSLHFLWVGRYNKTVNDWLLGKQEVLFPRGSQHWGRGETKLTVSLSLGPVIKCILFHALKIW